MNETKRSELIISTTVGKCDERDERFSLYRNRDGATYRLVRTFSVTGDESYGDMQRQTFRYDSFAAAIADYNVLLLRAIDSLQAPCCDDQTVAVHEGRRYCSACDADL